MQIHTAEKFCLVTNKAGFRFSLFTKKRTDCRIGIFGVAVHSAIGSIAISRDEAARILRAERKRERGAK